MYILGISAFYHDSAVALIRDGTILCAAQEERFTRKKNDAGFPTQAVNYCLSEADVQINDIQHVVYYEDTLLKFDRIIKSYSNYLPESFRVFHAALSAWLTEKINARQSIAELLKFDGEIAYVPHHLSHAASAYYPSPFNHSAILCVDAVGEWATTSIGLGSDNRVNLLKEIKYPHSLGMLYSAFTQFAGFRVNSGEYKLMGLAPYGEAIYTNLIQDHFLQILILHQMSFGLMYQKKLEAM